MVRDRYTCQYCGIKGYQAGGTAKLEIDHKIPRAAGGTDNLDNLITACQACNSGKSDGIIEDNKIIFRKRNKKEKLIKTNFQIKNGNIPKEALKFLETLKPFPIDNKKQIQTKIPKMNLEKIKTIN